LINNPFLSLPKRNLSVQTNQSSETKEEQKPEIKNSEKKHTINKPTNWSVNPFGNGVQILKKTQVSRTFPAFSNLLSKE
jgi:hypothetical protein